MAPVAAIVLVATLATTTTETTAKCVLHAILAFIPMQSVVVFTDPSDYVRSPLL